MYLYHVEQGALDYQGWVDRAQEEWACQPYPQDPSLRWHVDPFQQGCNDIHPEEM